MHDPEPPLESEPEESAAEGDFEPSPAKPVKPRATAGSSRSKSRSRKTVVEPELEEEAPTENVESQAVVQTADVEDEGEEKSKPSRKMKGRPTKSRSKKKVDPELADEEQELVENRRDTINASTSVPSQRSQPSAPQPRQQSQPGSRPLSQLDRFANLPPSSPVAVTPQKSKASKTTELPREALDISVQDGAMQARRVIEDLAKENEAGLRDPLSDDQRGMTLEELVRSEMRRQYEAMEREGKALIGKWEERTRESRLCIEGV